MMALISITKNLNRMVKLYGHEIFPLTTPTRFLKTVTIIMVPVAQELPVLPVLAKPVVWHLKQD
jgi:hypothetical protein